MDQDHQIEPAFGSGQRADVMEPSIPDELKTWIKSAPSVGLVLLWLLPIVWKKVRSGKRG